SRLRSQRNSRLASAKPACSSRPRTTAPTRRSSLTRSTPRSGPTAPTRNASSPSPDCHKSNTLPRMAGTFPRAPCSSRPSRSRAANFVLGLNALQMNKVHDYAGVPADQLGTLEHLGVFKDKPLVKAKDSKEFKRPLVNPYDKHADLDARVRSYLHANCSICHV